MSLTENYFQLFDLPEQYQLDSAALRNTYRELQRKTHPDKFTDASQHEQMLAVQYAATINDAHDVLKSPLKRAIYMLKLRGIEMNEQGSAALDPEFLMEQMQLREELEQAAHAADPETALEKVTEHLEQELAVLQDKFAEQIDQGYSGELSAALETVNKMQFLVKLETEVEHLEHELLND